MEARKSGTPCFFMSIPTIKYNGTATKLMVHCHYSYMD